MATNKRSISEGSDEKGPLSVLFPPNSNVPISCCQCYSGSSRVGGESVVSSYTNKRPSGEVKTDDAAKRQKITFGIGTKQSIGKDKSKDVRENTKPGIQIKLGSHKSNIPIPPVKSRPKAAIFNSDSDDEEPEEMPPEAKMRMRNIGRDTPTSAGPNSFGKTKQGFCDSKKVFEKSLKAAIEKAGND